LVDFTVFAGRLPKTIYRLLPPVSGCLLYKNYTVEVSMLSQKKRVAGGENLLRIYLDSSLGREKQKRVGGSEKSGFLVSQ
jgi:hypothetical protein